MAGDGDMSWNQFPNTNPEGTQSTGVISIEYSIEYEDRAKEIPQHSQEDR